MTAKAKGDYDELVRLFATANPMTMSHWNPVTGEMFRLPRGKNAKAAASAFETRLWQEEDWLEVPYLESDAAHALALAFARGLRPGKGKTEILEALAEDKPFRKLRAVLGRAPGLQRRYDAVLDAEAETRLVMFCEELDLSLDDPRFAVALAELQAHEPVDGVEQDPHEVGPLRSPGSLSIGRRRGDEG